MASESEKKERERYAHDEMCKAIKEHEHRRGKERTGESIEREVRHIAENNERKKINKLYQ